ncbi:SDR family NAD(P)-dependent oxidoreductase [Xanthomonas campestris]|uniref:SDR family NAD(P)-dependent oxidoreductase n=1 Tax=Xanthomonas campestris TaxID=339 RepID=UPI002368CACA|nr:SDR family oxidoreductase [Xanthomonas campestris]WDK84570.1 SDR family oxidoreductase [Xanthomonas campestris pv. campestris]WDK85885.1 SDR family oxidoreductase [Xanthomonas campestris pv. campestris]WDK90026.1 SDR family oxidoreductase [Xanthomonas campestris pv. campestris]WDL39749.1 SDR family oxidoreductase [Xanthomonas campestris pv. campestris]
MSVSPVFALITGASSGIGREIARAYAARGMPLILTARRVDQLEALAAELGAQVRVEILPEDLGDPAAPARLVAEIQRQGWTVGTLVNNAGYGVPGRYLQNDWQTHARFLQVMVTAVCELTWRLLPMIRASGQGRILNVASFAALTPSADGQTLYAAAKSFMLRFSESLALENADCAVKVCALCPGFAWSEFHDVTRTRAAMSTLPGWAWLQADAVAAYGIAALERGQVLAIPGWRYRLVNVALHVLPHALLLRLMAHGSHRVRPLENASDA